MSCKVNLTNGVSLNFESQLYTKTPALDASVKFAGEEAKDRLYEPKHKKKLVRVLTVIAYVFFVSLAAIMLSLYYIFIWNGDQQPLQQQYVRVYSKCDSGTLSEVQQVIDDGLVKNSTNQTKPSTTSEENSTWLDDDNFNILSEEDDKSSELLDKLIFKKYPYAEND